MSSSLELGDIGLKEASILSVFRYDMPIGNVAQAAFNGNGHIQDVCISAAESIDNYVFNGCYELTSLDLPGIVDYSSIDIFGGPDLHARFHNLSKITIAHGTTKFGSLLANLPALEYLEIPDTLTAISENAFIGCTNLHDLKLGHGIVLGTDALEGLDQLSSVEFPILPETAADIGAAHLPALSHIKVLSSDRPFQLKTQLSGWKASDPFLEFEGYAANLTALSEHSFESCAAPTVDIHAANLTSVAANSFKDYHGLIKLPTTVRILEQDCFSGADPFDLDALPNVMTVHRTGTRLNMSKFPESVIAVQASAFMDAHFGNGVVSLGDNISTLGKHAFARSDANYVSLNSSTLMTVPEACFADCTELTAASIAGSYQAIALSAFTDCIGLEHVDFGNVESIGAYAFKNTSIVSDASNSIDFTHIKSIGDNAFQNCKSLTDIRLAADVLHALGQTVFNSCTMLTAITIPVTNAELNEALSAQAGGSLIPASPEPDDVKEVYGRLKTLFMGASSADPQFVLYLNDCNISFDGSGMQYKCLTIDGSVLTKCDKTKSDFKKFCSNPVIPSAVTTIGTGAFEGIDDTSLTAVALHTNVKTINDRAFRGCTSLADINLARVTSIGLSAFSETALETVTLPTGLTSLGQYAFSGCSYLTSFSLGSSLASLPTGFIAGSTGIVQLTVPASISEFQDNALESTSSTLAVRFEAQSRDVMREMLGIANRAGASAGATFYGSDNAYKYSMFICTSPSSIYEVKNRAFNVSIALDLISVDDSMLGYDTITADMLGGLRTIKTGAFSGITKTPSVILPVLPDYSDIAVGIEDNAFLGWGSLERIDIAVNYEDFLSKHILLPPWTPSIWGVRYTATIHFMDGVLRMSGAEWVFETIVDTFVWTLIDGKKTVWKVNNLCAQTEEKIPDDFYAIGSGSLSTTTKIEVLSAQNIAEISANAFTSNQSIKTVHFGNALSVIADTAFERSAISAMKFPASMPTVSACGLNRAYFLKELAFSGEELPYKGTKEIAPSAFINMQAELSSLEFGTTLTSVGDYAFAELETVFPRIDNADFKTAKALRRIGDYAFFNSIRKLQDDEFIAPPSLSVIGDCAFGYHKEAYTQELSSLDLTPVNGSLKNVHTIGLSAFIRNRFKSIKFNRSGALATIGDYAFAYPRYKYDLYLPKTVASVGENAFKGNIILNPDAVRKNIISVDTTIDKFAADDYSGVDDSIFKVVKNEYAQAFNRAGFTDHTCLSALKSDYYTGFAYVFQNAMHFCPSSLSIDVLTRTVVDAKTNVVTAFVPAFVDSIGEGAFKDCTALTALSVLNPGSSIEASAFYNCSSLSTINAPGSFMLNDAPDYAFYGCKKLCNVQLLSSIARIGDYAFAGCESLNDVWLSSMNELNVDLYPLSSIGSHAFDGCSGLSVFYVFPGIKHIGSDPFKDCSDMQNIWVYLDDTQFRDVVDPSLSIKDAVKRTFGSVRSDNKCRINFLNSVYMNDGEVKIDDEYVVLREFDSTNKLSAVESVKYWQMVNDNQTYLNLSAVSEIDPFAFAECPNIKSLNFLADESKGIRLSSIGDFAFNNCSKLAKVNGNALSCSVIGDYAFANCESLIRMQFDIDFLQSIGQGAFYKTNMNEIRFTAQSLPIADAIDRLKQIMHYNASTNRNPLEVPEFCQFIVVASDKTGKYDCLLNDLTYSDVDTCTNQMVFVDKTKDSIRPVLIVKSKDGYLPAIVSNSFHANVIGRWK